MDLILRCLDPIFFDPVYKFLWESLNSTFCSSSLYPSASISKHKFLLEDWRFHICERIQQNVHDRLSIYEKFCSVFVVTV